MKALFARRTLLTGLLLSLCCAASAQQPVVPAQDTAAGAQPADEVFRLISRLKSTLDDPAAPLGNHGATAPFGSTPTLRDVAPAVPAGASHPETVNQSDSIQQKLDLLRTLMESRSHGAFAVPNQLNSPEPAGTGPQPGADHLLSSPPASSPGHGREGQPQVQADVDAAHGPGAEAPDHDLHGAPVFSAPIDPLELGFSLFATGDAAMALKSLESVDPAVTDPVDRQWLDYMHASCLRLTGQRDRAEGLYREMIASSQEGFPVSAAEWWMTWLQRRKQLDADTAQVIEAIGQWQAKYPGEGN